MAKRALLILDDDPTFLSDIQALLGKAYTFFPVGKEEEAFVILSERKIDVMFLDLMLGGGRTGLDVLKKVREEVPDLPVIILTAYASVDTAVSAMKLGAYHYISKSPNIEELKTLIDRAVADRMVRREYQLLREEVDRATGTITGKSQAVQQVIESIHRVALSDVTVLITGESGTGKELVARAIHNASKRSQHPFVTVNCASLVKDLVESELFGHQKGAFTGAIQTKIGKFELAEGGTIFLDEIAELDTRLQVKLLRVLQEREIDRIGGTAPIPVDVRIIAATNRNLPQMIEQGLFREDLFYRLNVYPISLPALRDHKEDIPLLVDQYLEQYCRELGRQKLEVSPVTLECMMRYDWHGNVRELQNVIQRAVLLSTGQTVEPEHLPKELVEGTASVPVEKRSLRDLEREARENAARTAIYRVLESTDWNVKESAKILEIPEKTLYDRCRKLGIKLSSR
ncbi:MAG TPA: sigma-54 dependent transcriptional regulator [Bacteroidota bacterium]|nr:sigma-54 dependent transcriptional regulator [Bacteroidota bacterium]